MYHLRQIVFAIAVLFGCGMLFAQEFTVPLTVTDGANTSKLYIGMNPAATDGVDVLFDTLAPPPPPLGAFDARLRQGADDFIQDLRSSTVDTTHFSMLYQPASGQGPIVLSWDRILLAGLGQFLITDDFGGQLFGPIDMSLQDSLVLDEPVVESRLRILVIADPPPAAKLLITEFVVTPTAGEFVEIYNPGSEAVDLSYMYLTDATSTAGGGTYYYQIVEGGGGGGGSFDFHARFPDSASIAPGEYQTVAMAGDSLFFATYGVLPTYELFDDGTAFTSDVPDMREAFPGSINNQGGLTNGDEVAVLYYWNGRSDLVTDVDYVLYNSGSPVANNEAVDKTGVRIDGPDSGPDSTEYLADTPIASQRSAPNHAFGRSTQRVDLLEGAQLTNGGNGVGGRDETSENLDQTFDNAVSATPNGPYLPPSARVQLIHNAADPAADTVDVYVNGNRLLDDFAFRTATPYVDIPAGVTLNVGVAPGNSTSVDDTLANFSFVLADSVSYVMAASGVLDSSQFAQNPDGFSTSFTLLVQDSAREVPDNTQGALELFAVHGATDAPFVDVVARNLGSTLLNNLPYGTVSGYNAVPPLQFILDVTDSSQANVLASFIADLMPLAGKTAVVLASGFLDSTANQNGPGFALLGVLADGTVINLPMEPPPPAPPAAKLLITEIVVTPAAGEFIEIYNPGSDPVDLDNYYLTDATFQFGNTYYYQIVEGGGGGGGFADWHARFPGGSSIAAGEYQTVALAGDSAFFATYAAMPTYELFDDGNAPAGDAPDMLEATPGSISGQGGMTDGDEVAILYHWDGQSDLVTDVDYVIYGATVNEQVDKTGVRIDGPDAGTDSSMYAPDVDIASQIPAPTHALGFSISRVDLSEGSQVTSGGNGVDGRNEMSENLDSTFVNDRTPSPNGETPPPPAPPAAKLLITEIVVTPTAGEFIEIYNPGSDPVDLDNYYLTDATFQFGNTYYYQIVEGGGGGGGFADWHARFPGGSSIAAGEYQTVALAGDSAFFATYAAMPTYELFDDGNAPAGDAPDMLEATPGSISGQGGMTDGDEVAILYHWDGQSDLVTDVDYVIYGATVNEQVDKTGVRIDGPDAGTDSSMYAPDVDIASQVPAPTHALGFSISRVDLSEGTQIMTGGNGIDGRNEMSENLHITFTDRLAPSPNLATPQPPAVKLLITEIVVTPAAGEFIEIYNPGSDPVDLGNYYLTDATFQFGNTYYYQIVEGGGGGGGFADWHARFPGGSSIAAGEYQTVALAGDSAFFATYAAMPTYELFDDGNAPAGDAPDMLEATPGSISGQGGMTDGDEVAILYHWDGQSDLVTDVDYVIYGATVNEQVDKTGVRIDGPDAGTDSSMYAPDVDIASQIPAQTHSDGLSISRIDFTEGGQIRTGGNGVDGRNEMSENLDSTFATRNPTPNSPTSPLGIDDDDMAGIPLEYSLDQNYPNPFNPTTTLRYGLRESGDVKLEIYNVLGQLVRTLVNAAQTAGRKAVLWDGLNDQGVKVSSGIYVYRLQAGDYVRSRKMILMK